MAKPTVHDIAKEAGVSLATVDRVLNARPGVREKTVERVQSAIQSLGYIRDLSAANLARRREYRFAVVLPQERSQFVATLRAAFQDMDLSAVTDRTRVTVYEVETREPHALGRILAGIDRSRFDGVAIMAPETPVIRDAIARLKGAGLAVVAFVSDLPNSEPDHFVGVNNIAAGRTAAALMGRFLGAAGGKVLVVANSMLARDSLERRIGFDDLMGERFAEVVVLPTVEAHNDPARMSRIVRSAVRNHPEIRGVYALASGNQALVKALRDQGVLSDQVLIAHELTPHNRAALEALEIDAVITQNVGHLVRSAVRVLRAKCDGVNFMESQEQIRIDVILKENLPMDDGNCPTAGHRTAGLEETI